MKIPFNIKFRPQIESGEYKVETRDGKPTRIVCWDLRGNEDFFILALVEKNQKEVSYCYPVTGCCKAACDPEGKDDLFIVTPESELTEFEKAIEGYIKSYTGIVQTDVAAKQWAAELLDLAREQFIKDCYIIEKKMFHDAVENISDKHRAEMSVEYSIHCKVEDGTRHAIMNWNTFQKVAQKFIDIGRAEALKVLPRWKKAERDMRVVSRCVIEQDDDIDSSTFIPKNSYYISAMDLLGLPGFKED